MNLIKIFFQKFGSGLFIGIVAGITAGFIFGILSMIQMQDMLNNDSDIMEQASITKHREVVRHGKTVILGTVKNNSEDSMRMFEIKVDLYNKDGEFVDQCTEYISSLHGGKQTNFEVLCKSCDSNKSIEHTSYKVYMGGF